jgi:hypothetical protein
MGSTNPISHDTSVDLAGINEYNAAVSGVKASNKKMAESFDETQSASAQMADKLKAQGLSAAEASSAMPTWDSRREIGASERRDVRNGSLDGDGRHAYRGDGRRPRRHGISARTRRGSILHARAAARGRVPDHRSGRPRRHHRAARRVGLPRIPKLHFAEIQHRRSRYASASIHVLFAHMDSTGYTAKIENFTRSHPDRFLTRPSDADIARVAWGVRITEEDARLPFDRATDEHRVKLIAHISRDGLRYVHEQALKAFDEAKAKVAENRGPGGLLEFAQCDDLYGCGANGVSSGGSGCWWLAAVGAYVAILGVVLLFFPGLNVLGAVLTVIGRSWRLSAGCSAARGGERNVPAHSFAGRFYLLCAGDRLCCRRALESAQEVAGGMVVASRMDHVGQLFVACNSDSAPRAPTVLEMNRKGGPSKPALQKS